jgi:hypothetical protein
MAAPSRRKEFDHLKRYLLPDPVNGGKDMPWTRVSTYAKSISDMYGLTQWEKRMVAKGIGLRSDLYALACATPVEDSKTLNEVAEKAKEAAAASKGANLGTALHSFTEALDRGLEPVVPAEWRADVDAYRAQMTRYGLTVGSGVHRTGGRHPGIEPRREVRSGLGVGGSATESVDLGDVKTTQRIEFSWMEIAVQLACYAHASTHLGSGVRVLHPDAGCRPESCGGDACAGWWRGLRPVRHRHRERVGGRATVCPGPCCPFVQVLCPTIGRAAVTEPVNGYADRLRTAASVGELSAIWKEASAAGKWTHDLEVTGMARKAELESGAQ